MRQPTRPNCRSSLAPHLPTSRAASALLYVKATAGLRLLPVLQAELLLAAVSRSLSNRTLCPFSFVEARVISGEEEALFGWLAINQLLGLLPRPLSTATQVGWLDLGGEALRQVVSGLVKHISEEAFAGSRVLCVANMKPSKMRGVESTAMVLCGTNAEGRGCCSKCSACQSEG